jgi:hypothetical protein
METTGEIPELLKINRRIALAEGKRKNVLGLIGSSAKNKWCKACLRRGKFHERTCDEIITNEQETQTIDEDLGPQVCDKCHKLEKKIAGMKKMVKNLSRNIEAIERSKRQMKRAYQTAQQVLEARLADAERRLAANSHLRKNSTDIIPERVSPAEGSKAVRSADADTQTESTTVGHAPDVVHQKSTQTEVAVRPASPAQPARKQSIQAKKKKKKKGVSPIGNYHPAKQPMPENKVLPLIYDLW